MYNKLPGNDIDIQKQEQKANLGKMVEQLKVLLPDILNKSLPKEIISSGIILRICPSHFDQYNAYVPALQGQVSYYATCKTIQMILTSVVLSPKIKLHIQSIRVTTENDVQTIYPGSTKITVRWTTCPENCRHLFKDSNGFFSTSHARLGSHKWTKLDPNDLIHSQDSSSLTKTFTTLGQLTSTLIGLTKEHKKLERIICGIFIFELNDQNDKIRVHTIEDIDIIEKTQLENVENGLRIC